jgi:hypothetical protein
MRHTQNSNEKQGNKKMIAQERNDYMMPFKRQKVNRKHNHVADVQQFEEDQLHYFNAWDGYFNCTARDIDDHEALPEKEPV